jgi:4-hydroxyacetophenone monooxygenase
MALGSQLVALPADDTALLDALSGAELVSLLAAVAHITGNLGVLRPELRPDPARLREPQTGYTPEQIALAESVIAEALRHFRVVQGQRPVELDQDNLRRIMNFCVGSTIDDGYLPLLTEELALDGDRLRRPSWTKVHVAPARPFNVIIIGAGMSGLAAAHRLHPAGVDVTVLERSDGVGGTWRHNTYPGCRVDLANHLYSYSFAQRYDWPWYFSPQPVLAEYFEHCASHMGLDERLRFGCDVRAARWDEGTKRWSVDIAGPVGNETLTANVVISAVGQLNQPKLPDIEGRNSFNGPSFHSARWDHTVDLIGKRVVVIGTGASACQFIPLVAKQAARLTVLQRTPPWLIPAPRYFQPVEPGFNWLLSHVPFYAEWYRFFLFWRGAEGLMESAIVDESYPPTERAVSAKNDELRALLTMFVQAVAGDDPALCAKLIPSYPPLAKRFVLDDGTYIYTLRQPNVDLVTESIHGIEANGVRTADGALHEADVIIYGTGFAAADFLTPMEVIGRDDTSLHQRWGGDARAYMGIAIPQFPNFFTLYGPNTNIVVNGSIIYFSECEVHLVTECIHAMLHDEIAAIEPTEAAHDTYNTWVDAGNKLRPWGWSGVNSWYKNATGRSAQNWPFSVLEFWQQTRSPRPSDWHRR